MPTHPRENILIKARKERPKKLPLTADNGIRWTVQYNEKLHWYIFDPPYDLNRKDRWTQYLRRAQALSFMDRFGMRLL
jgi:hypothetical protein